MIRRRVHTTISLKHWDLLKKHTGKYGTQQKVIELALESLDRGSKQDAALSQEELLWMRLRGLKSVCLIYRDLFAELINNMDVEQMSEAIICKNMAVYVIEWHYHKPLKALCLKEVMDGLVDNIMMGSWFDSVNYTEDGSHYVLEMVHSMGINNSRMNRICIENLFNEYGVRTESTISENSVFMKVYKKL